MNKFKVGDKVKIIGCSAFTHCLGKTATLLKYDGYKYWECENNHIHNENEIKLVEDTPKPKFKVGDRVRMLEKQSTEKIYTFEDTRQGKEGYVIKKINNKEGTEYWCYYSKGEHDWIEQQDLELVEEECKSCPETATEISLESQSCGVLTTDILNKAYNALSQSSSLINHGLIGELAGFNYYVSNEPTTSSIKKGGSIMSKLTSFVKNSLLSADEKLLRKYDLKDSCGDYTSEAEELVMKKLIKDNEAYLIEVATALEAEEKKNK